MRQLNIKENELLFLIQTKPELQPFFFRKVKGLHWFYPLLERGFFSPEKNPKPLPVKEEGYVNIPTWLAIEYLVASSKELSIPDNLEYAEQFIKLIREITSYARSEKYSNYRTWWQLTQIIRNIPSHLISIEDIDLIDYWLDDPYDRGLIAGEIGEKWLSDLIEKRDEHCNQIALWLLDILFKINFSDQKKEITLRYDAWHAKKIVEKIAVLSGNKLGIAAVEFFQNRLTSILDVDDKDKWLSLLRRAINDHEQNHSFSDVENVLINAYRDCLLGFVDHDVDTTIIYLRTIFEGQYQTLKRIAIYTVDKKYAMLRSLVNNILLSDFFHDKYRHEVWHLLNNHYKEFDSDQQKLVIDIIEGLEVFDNLGNLKEKATAYRRTIWLSAIKDFSQQTNQLYQKYTDIAEVKPEHPDFSSHMSFRWVAPESPIPLENLLSLNTDSLIEIINSYEDPDRFSEPGLEGLVNCFKGLVKAKAHEIYQELMKFIDCDLAFIDKLIEVYREFWCENKELPWGDIWPILLDFCLELVKRDVFWSEENAKEREQFVANRHWVISEIGRLMEEGTKSDDHAFDKALLPKAEQILLTILTKQKGVEFKQDSDAVFVAINSPRGHCIEALINLSLRLCRLADIETGSHQEVWNQHKPIYDSEMKRSEQGEYEFAALIGMYLPNFHYMSRDWVRDNLAIIFNQSDYQKWLCVMQGFAYADVVWWVYGEIYNYLKESKDFLNVLDDENLKERVEEKVIQSIVISYIKGVEDLNNPDSLISKLISRKDYQELNHLIGFIWTLNEEKVDKLHEKVFGLWDRLLKILDFHKKEDRKLASQLCHWIVFIDRIDSVTENWLLKIAPYAEDYNSYKFLENLARLSESQALEVQKVWLKMLVSYAYPYPENAICQIFRNLVKLGPEGKRKAEEVVDAYLKLGIEMPRKLLETLYKES